MLGLNLTSTSYFNFTGIGILNELAEIESEFARILLSFGTKEMLKAREESSTMSHTTFL